MNVGPIREAQHQAGQERGWAERMDWAMPGLSERLVGFAESCSGLGVGYAIERVLVLRIGTAAGLVNPVGFDPDHGVGLPWRVGPYKAESRALAAAVAAAIPGAFDFECPKLWSVRKIGAGGRVENLSCVDVLDASQAIRRALAVFAAAVRSPLGGAP